MNNYFKTKLKLFENLNEKSTAIINNDDKYAKKIIKNLKCKYLTYGFKKESDLYVKSYNLKINGTHITFSFKNEDFDLNTNLIGRFNIYNLMGAILTSLKLG